MRSGVVLAIVFVSAMATVGAMSQQAKDSNVNQQPQKLPTCSGSSNCESGPLICTDNVSWETLPITVVDNHTVSSDGRGSYQLGTNVKTAGAGVIGGMVLAPLDRKIKAPRAIVVDLNEPVPGGGGVPLGVIVDNADLNLAAQWYTDADLVRHNLHEIPVGAIVNSQQFAFGVHISGAYHWMQVGPQPVGHCHAGGTAINGNGTSSATIAHVSASRWEIDLPSGSTGRLWDAHHTDPYAVDRGLYFVDLHLIVGQ